MGMIRRSWLSRIRPESAEIRKTSESASPASPASTAVLISISGAIRRRPRRIRPSRSVSAWNLTRMARTLQLRDYFRVGPPRLLVMRLSGTLPIRKVCIDLLLIRQVECKRTVHLFQAQGRIILDHSLGRDSFAKQIDQ